QAQEDGAEQAGDQAVAHGSAPSSLQQQGAQADQQGQQQLPLPAGAALGQGQGTVGQGIADAGAAQRLALGPRRRAVHGHQAGVAADQAVAQGDVEDLRAQFALVAAAAQAVFQVV